MKKQNKQKSKNKIFGINRKFLLIWLVTLIILFVGVIIFAYHLAYWGKIYPWVTVSGIDLANQTELAAEAILQQKAVESFNNQPVIRLIYQENEWDVLKAKINFTYLPQATAREAYLVGREGKLAKNILTKWQAWQGQIDLPIRYKYDADLLTTEVATIAAEINIPPVSPALEILPKPTSDGSLVTVKPGEPGQTLNTEETIRIINQQLVALDTQPIFLPVKIIKVDTSDEEINKTKVRAEILAKKQLTITAEEEAWILKGQQLINFLDFKNGFDEQKISDYILTLAKAIDRKPQNAAFQFTEGRVAEFRAAKDGLALNQDQAKRDLKEKLINAETATENSLVLKLAVDHTLPGVTLDQVNNLGLKELLGKGASTFRGSIPGRVHNIALSASRINGVLVAPGETFSFNQTVGEVSNTTGYQQAYVIRSGSTVLDDGGGVCQTSTTLFRALLDAGLPITERRAHSYRVGYYEQNAKAGLDATVYAPTADLKFTNDTPGHLLIQTTVAGQSLIIEIYGTSDGRQAQIANHRIWDIVPAPPPRYQDDPTLPAGTEKQVDWAASGAKVKFDYIVKRGGETIFSKTFYSNFQPWQAVYLRGTG